MNKVAKSSLGRNPINAFDYNSIYTDVALSSVEGKTYVRNVDGYFVEVAPKKKSDKNIVKIQKDLLSLLGIQFPLSYLQAYSEIHNGDFSALKQRALQEKQRQQPNKFGVTVITKEQVTSEDRFKNYYKIITSPVQADVVELDGNNYYQIMSIQNGEKVFLKADQTLTTQQVRNVMKDLNITRNVPKKLSAIGSRIEKVKGLNKKIEELKNCK